MAIPAMIMRTVVLPLVLVLAVAAQGRATNNELGGTREQRLTQINMKIAQVEAMIKACESTLDASQAVLDNAERHPSQALSGMDLREAADTVYTMEGNLGMLYFVLNIALKQRDNIIAEPYSQAIDKLAGENAALQERMDNIGRMMAQGMDEEILSAEEYEQGVNLLRQLKNTQDANNRRIESIRRSLDRTQQGGGGNDGGGGNTCFLSGTLVLMADGSFRPIERVQAGEFVLSRDRETGENAPARVEEARSGVDNHYYLLGNGIRANGAHRFVTEDRGPVSVADLEAGDVLVGPQGPQPLDAVRYVPLAAASAEGMAPLVRVHNLIVRGTHAYFVSGDGEHGFLVLDDCSCTLGAEQGGQR